MNRVLSSLVIIHSPDKKRIILEEDVLGVVRDSLLRFPENLPVVMASVELLGCLAEIGLGWFLVLCDALIG